MNKLDSDQLWEKAQCFAADFRRLVRRYVPEYLSEEYHELLPQMQDATSCYSPVVWTESYKPKTPVEMVFHVYFPGDRAAGLNSFEDTIRVSCESNDWGSVGGEVTEFFKGAISEWYDGAHVSAAEVASERQTDRIDRLIARLANLNPDAGEIGAGMLKQIVDEARELKGE